MVATGSGPGLIRDFHNAGEHLTTAAWSNMFLIQRMGLARWLIKKLLGAVGMGRLVEGTKMLYVQDNESYE